METTNYSHEVVDVEPEGNYCWKCQTPTLKDQLSCSTCSDRLRDLKEIQRLFHDDDVARYDIPSNSDDFKTPYLMLVRLYAELFLYVRDFFEECKDDVDAMHAGLKWIQCLLVLQVHKKRMESSLDFSRAPRVLEWYEHYTKPIARQLREFSSHSEYQDFQLDYAEALLTLKSLNLCPFDREAQWLIQCLVDYERDVLNRLTSRFVRAMDRNTVKTSFSFYFDAEDDKDLNFIKLWSLQKRLHDFKRGMKTYMADQELKRQLFPK